MAGKKKSRKKKPVDRSLAAKKGWKTRRARQRRAAREERRSKQYPDFEWMRPMRERAKRAAVTRRKRQLAEREPADWQQWDYVEEPIDDVGGPDGDT